MSSLKSHLITDRQKPTIVEKVCVAQTAIFQIESLKLEFNNGEKRHYERLKPKAHHGVIVVPVTKDGDLILVREYAAGTERYELGFVKGGVDPNESIEEAANRELKEEIGFGAHQLTFLRDVLLSPAYLSSSTSLFLAEELYPAQLEGDEPEPLEVLYWPLNRAHELLNLEQFNEPRCLTALYLVLTQLGILSLPDDDSKDRVTDNSTA